MSEEKQWYTIYKWYCKDPSVKDVYIGKTVDLKARKIKHKSVCNNPSEERYNNKKYVFIREHGNIFNWDFDVLEKVYGFKRDAEKIETEYIKKFSSNCLNTMVSFLTEEERKEAKNKQRRKEYHKNPEKFRKRNREARAKNPEKFRKREREYDKKRRKERKPYTDEYNANYYVENKADIRKKQKVKYDNHWGIPIECQYCSVFVARKHMKRHQSRNICKKVQFALPFDHTIHKMCSVCQTKILIKDESFMHNCNFEIEDDNRPLKKKRKL